MWGRIDECVPVCLCIYESCGRRRKRGSSQAQLGKLNQGVGRLCPFPFSAGCSEPTFQIYPQLPPPCQLGPLPSECPFPQAAQRVGGGGLLPIPPGPGPTPSRSLGPPDTGAGGGWWWGEALKAGDCLEELGDRAPIVPAPEPPQWSSLAQRGFDNGQVISMQSQPLSPLPVPQPRGGK